MEQEKISIIIPANNEEEYIKECLESLLQQKTVACDVQIIVAANGCSDRTVDIGQSYKSQIKTKGWALNILEIPTGNKANALNVADATAQGDIRIYLDADVTCEPELINRLSKVLSQDAPIYATGKLQVMEARTWITRRYAELWTNLPFMKDGAAGAGLFAVNKRGRARWAEFPDIISDDTYVRLHFSQKERVEVDAMYYWPMVEGYKNLVRVRHRQNVGVNEIYKKFPDLRKNEEKTELGITGIVSLFLSAPLGFVTYAFVAFSVRLKGSKSEWTRGR